MNEDSARRIPIRHIGVAVAAVLAVQGCSPSTPTPPLLVGTVEVTTPDPSSGSTSQTSGECGHDYFPSEEGTAWELAVTGDGTNYNSTATITESRDEGFTLVSGLADGSSTFTMEVSCSDDGLIMLDPVQQSVAASVNTDEGSATVTTVAQTGVTLPADLEGASTWQQYVAWKAQGSDTVLYGDATIEYVSRGFEVVTVPLGTFNAIRVDSENRGTLQGEELMSCQVSVWYAKDVGIVKQEQTCSSMQSSYDLVSFDSP
jgi:hypothetical protein